MSNALYESEIEKMALDSLYNDNGYSVLFGPDIAEGPGKERDYGDVVLHARLAATIDRLNPAIPAGAREDALRQALRADALTLLDNNEAFHRLLTDGIDSKFAIGEGKSRTDKVWLIDWEQPERNEFLAVNQFTVASTELSHRGSIRRPDIVLFVNGLPLVVVELKNASDEHADIQAAYQQLHTYKEEIPALFVPNALLIISDGWFAKVGGISSPYQRFMEWKTADGVTLVDPRVESALVPMIRGLLNKPTLLDLIRHFIVFEKSREQTVKKIAAYHQYYAVNRAIESTLRAAAPAPDALRQLPAPYGLPTVASQPKGDKRAGVVWHTQGSGKSLSMLFYAGKLVLAEAMNNPTLVVITDRNDLDQQLFETFSNCQQLLRQTPVQAANREELKKLLAVASGGVIFTTIQKFLPNEKGGEYPLLSERRNVVVIADEAHRSQYDFIDGFARHMRDALPNASFIGFTGTPIEKEDASTQAVFGNYVDIYDIQQAVEDGATVPIYYESRLAQIRLSEADQRMLDERVEEITEDDELTERQKRFARWSSKEAVVGSRSRLEQVAADLIAHFEARQSAATGKGLIVCMSRRICVAMHNEIVKLRPEWYDPDDTQGRIKIVMTGSASDPLEWQEHIRNKPRRKAIGDRLKDPSDPLQLLIVRDMFLTGFDAPVLNTMYIDKPMNGHNLMQAIARVNRVYRDKPGGLIVDYLGIAADLKQALSFYSDSGGKGDPALVQEQAVALLLEKLEVVGQLFHGFAYEEYFWTDTAHKLSLILAAEDFILGLEDGRRRYINEVTALSQAFAIAIPHAEALAVKDEVAFFQAVKARLSKFDATGSGRTDEEMETAIRQVIDAALVSDQVVDIYDAAGLKKPDISILSDEFLLEIQGMEHKNLALEVLRKLLNDEIRARAKKNLVQSKKLEEMLEEALRRYHNKAITSAQVIEELINLGKEIRDSDSQAAEMGLSDFEYAFYTAVANNDSARQLMQQEMLRELAVVLTERVRANTSIDWTLKESVRAKLRVIVRRTLRQYGYPPDMQLLATETVLKQAELLAEELAAK